MKKKMKNKRKKEKSKKLDYITRALRIEEAKKAVEVQRLQEEEERKLHAEKQVDIQQGRLVEHQAKLKEKADMERIQDFTSEIDELITTRYQGYYGKTIQDMKDAAVEAHWQAKIKDAQTRLNAKKSAERKELSDMDMYNQVREKEKAAEAADRSVPLSGAEMAKRFASGIGLSPAPKAAPKPVTIAPAPAPVLAPVPSSTSEGGVEGGSWGRTPVSVAAPPMRQASALDSMAEGGGGSWGRGSGMVRGGGDGRPAPTREIFGSSRDEAPSRGGRDGDDEPGPWRGGGARGGDSFGRSDGPRDGQRDGGRDFDRRDGPRDGPRDGGREFGRKDGPPRDDRPRDTDNGWTRGSGRTEEKSEGGGGRWR